MPSAKVLLGDRGYDAGWFRNALAERGIAACIPSKVNRKIPIARDRTLYRQHHKIENMFGRLKDWRRIHTRYDRGAHTFFSAICIAATVTFWIKPDRLIVPYEHAVLIWSWSANSHRRVPASR
jgi:transposase